MTFLELRQLVSYWVDDLNLTYFTPAQVNRFLNNAQREVQKLVLGAGQDFYMKCAQTTLVINQRDYVLPDDFYKVNRLEVVISGSSPNENVLRLNPITPNQLDLMGTQTGTPSVYFFKKNRFTLYPAPNSALTLRMLYSYKVADMVLDSDLPDVPEPYNEMIAVLAAMDCLLKDGRDVSALIEKRDLYMKMLKDDAAQRSLDESRSVQYTGTYDDYSSLIW